MKYLLDTHVFIWLVTGETGRLSQSLMDVIEKTENTLFLSAASIWEMMIKCSLNRLSIPKPEKSFLKEQMLIANVEALPVSAEHSFEIVNLPQIHKDPFDRMLVAQAKVEKLKIISKDSKIPLYDVDVIW